MLRLEWFLERPWRLVLVVALLVALPILIVGELSANDARARIRTAELDALAGAANRAAANLNARIAAIVDQVAAAAATPVSGKTTPLLLALEAGDNAAVGAWASYMKQILGASEQLDRVLVLDRAGHVVASDPALTRARIDYAASDVFTGVTVASPIHVSGLYLIEGSGQGMAGGSIGTPVLGVSALVRDLRGDRAGVVVAEVDLHLLGLALSPLLGTADDLYLIDGSGQLLLRAKRAFAGDPAFGRDLRGSTAGAAALADVRRLEADDPLDGGPRLIGTAAVSISGWHVIALRSPTAFEHELDAALLASRNARIALAVVLLIGSVLFARTAGRALRQRGAS